MDQILTQAPPDLSLTGLEKEKRTLRHLGHLAGDVTHRHRLVLTLWMTKAPMEEILKVTGYSHPNSIYRILHREDVQALRQQMLSNLDLEFENLYSSVIEAVQTGLESGDAKIRLEAAKVWLKEFSRAQPSNGKGEQDSPSNPLAGANISAEHIVFQILSQAKEEG